jgi:AcrR family transcriptional regulator
MPSVPTATDASTNGSTEFPLTRGHKKKARTRQRLLDTALEVLAEQGEGFNIADLAGRAGVSHGTFYNYFADREQLIDALVPHVVESFAARAAVEFDDPDPAVRFATITARALAAAVHQPETVRVALRIDAVQRALVVDGPLSYLRRDLLDGRASGRFVGPADDGTLDVVLGALLLAARRVIDGEVAPAYRRSVIARLLQSLGVPRDDAVALAKRAVGASR